jgi:hypothetical protein
LELAAIEAHFRDVVGRTIPILPFDAEAAVWQLLARLHSRFILEVLEERLALVEQVAGLEKTAGAWSDQSHPEMCTDEDIDRWLAGLRSQDSEETPPVRRGDSSLEALRLDSWLTNPLRVTSSGNEGLGTSARVSHWPLNPVDFEGIPGLSLALLPAEGAFWLSATRLPAGAALGGRSTRPPGKSSRH